MRLAAEQWKQLKLRDVERLLSGLPTGWLRGTGAITGAHLAAYLQKLDACSSFLSDARRFLNRVRWFDSGRGFPPPAGSGTVEELGRS